MLFSWSFGLQKFKTLLKISGAEVDLNHGEQHVQAEI